MRLYKLYSCQLLLLLTATQFFFGCSGTSETSTNPEAAYQEAQEEIESDNYSIAIEKLRVIKNRFPYSKYSVLAQLRIADVYFLQELWAEAASAYKMFAELHPKHEKVPYALYRAGESFYQDIPGNVSRDLSSAVSAISAFKAFLRKFPDKKQSDDARDRINQTRKILAEKELYIAEFYENWDQPESARRRYKKLLKLYPETEFANTAEEKLKEISETEERPDPSKYGPADTLPSP